MNEAILEDIQKEVQAHKVLLYVKGTKDSPQCGFSAAAIEIFNEIGKPFETIDVLASPDRRSHVPAYSHWPTFPQIFINGSFVGGCDIIREMHAEGQLAPMVEKAFAN